MSGTIITNMTQLTGVPLTPPLPPREERSLPFLHPHTYAYPQVPVDVGGSVIPLQGFFQQHITHMEALRPPRPAVSPRLRQIIRPAPLVPHPTSPPVSLSALLDPFRLFSRPKLTRKSYMEVEYPTTTAKTTTTTTKAPLVYFPAGDQGECGDYKPPGFDTYSFIGFLLGVVNIVAQVANNVNNNLNNNNNNNNDNNNNLDNINVANSNSNQNNMNTVTIPPAMGRRRKRGTKEEEEEEEEEEGSKWQRPNVEEVLAAAVAVPFLRTFWVLAGGRPGECVLRAVCEANFNATYDLHHTHDRSFNYNNTARDDSDLAQIFAAIFTEALGEWAPPAGVPRSSITASGLYGRRGQDCSFLSPHCSRAAWKRILRDVEDHQTMNLSFLKEEEGEEDLLDHIRNHSEDFADLGLPNIASIFNFDEFI
ncbi:M-phase inducer phosphatase-like isoform X2 [Homarus americanus]|nr:M-phase inducer phosphatase-like isoform X2 [Homarus americanus]